MEVEMAELAPVEGKEDGMCKRLWGTKELAPFGELKGGTRGFSAVVQRIAHNEPGVINRMQATLMGVLRIVYFSLS